MAQQYTSTTPQTSTASLPHMIIGLWLSKNDGSESAVIQMRPVTAMFLVTARRLTLTNCDSD